MSAAPAAPTVLPGFLDAHVHLALIDPAALVAGGISRVIDLGGWWPGTGRPTSSEPETVHAGQFLTAPGGYPSATGWAPPGSIAVVARATDAAAAVDRQLAGGASVIKITLNSAAGPVLGDPELAAIVGHARTRGVAVVAHVEGPGQAARAVRAGVTGFAHTPFTELLDDDLIAAAARTMTWISTLDMHGWGTVTDDFTRAGENLRRFHAHGGRVLYGTDLGNGPLPVGLNRRELGALLAAGLTPDAVLTALTDPAGFGSIGGLAPPEAPKRRTVIHGPRPVDPQVFLDWLCTARSVPNSPF